MIERMIERNDPTAKSYSFFFGSLILLPLISLFYLFIQLNRLQTFSALIDDQKTPPKKGRGGGGDFTI